MSLSRSNSQENLNPEDKLPENPENKVNEEEINEDDVALLQPVLKTNRLQHLLSGAVNALTVTVPFAAFGPMIDAVPAPFNVMVQTTGPVFALQTLNIANQLTTQEIVWPSLKEFGVESAKFTFELGLAGGLGASTYYLSPVLEQFIQIPELKCALLATMGLATYGGAELIYNCAIAAEQPPHNPSSNPLQQFGKDLVRGARDFSGLISMQIILSAYGQGALVKDPCFVLCAVLTLDQLGQLANYLTTTPSPMNSLVPENKEYQPINTSEEEGVVSLHTGPTASEKALAVGKKGLRVLAMGGVLFGANYLFEQIAKTQDYDPKKAQQGNTSYEYAAAAIATTIVIEKVLPTVAEPLGRALWSGAKMFGNGVNTLFNNSRDWMRNKCVIVEPEENLFGNDFTKVIM